MSVHFGQSRTQSLYDPSLQPLFPDPPETSPRFPGRLAYTHLRVHARSDTHSPPPTALVRPLPQCRPTPSTTNVPTLHPPVDHVLTGLSPTHPTLLRTQEVSPGVSPDSPSTPMVSVPESTVSLSGNIPASAKTLDRPTSVLTGPVDLPSLRPTSTPYLGLTSLSLVSPSHL